MIRDKTRPKPNRSNGRDKSASNSPLIISHRSRIRKSSRLPSFPDKRPYKNYLDDTSKSLSTQFLNLSKDAILVIPSKPYANIYQFATRSSDREWLALFRRVVKNVKKGQFISTHGHGVSYLHVRLEDNPKYYEEF